MKIQASCFEVGLGHYSRLRAVLMELKERGHEIICCADDPIYGLFREDGFSPVYKVQKVSWVEDFYKPQLLRDLRAFRNLIFKDGKKKSVLREVQERYHPLKRIYYKDKEKPDVFLSDSCPVTTFLAKRRNKHSVLISNETDISASSIISLPLSILQKLFMHYLEDSHLVIPDVAPPYTLSEFNLKNARRFKKKEYVGPFVEMSNEKGREDHIFVSLGGSIESRIYMRNVLKPVLGRLGYKWKMCMGVKDERYDESTDNYEIRAWLSDEERNDWLKNSLATVNNATHGICFEAIAYGKPFVTIPTHPEQLGNAKKCEMLGLSKNVVRIEDLEVVLNDVIVRIDEHKENVERLREISRNYDAANRTAEIVESAVAN